MSIASGFSETGFNRQALDLISILECREAVLDAEKEQIYRLRYAAYSRSDALPDAAPELFTDSLDEVENGRTFGFYIDGRLASSIRLHVATPANPVCPAMSAFSDCLNPMFDAGMSVVDPTRFVMDAEFAGKYAKLSYATIRLAWMACEQVSAGVLLATAGAEQQAFYRGIFGQRVICLPRPYPSLNRSVGLMALDFREARERVLYRYPFLRSTNCERDAIFGSAWPFPFRAMTSAPDWGTTHLRRMKSRPLELR